ncbi:hypothetical protein EB796_025196 [Bugula neritina]|uniref:Uncharacterized protein n=1 Tax=Bugula neritina TaxID=10212 RepID=A0A7J7ITF6_BUGNE|nr:hypothetical protein EB796_025196 [Bugula neritina]
MGGSKMIQIILLLFAGSPCSSANCDSDGGECKTIDGAMSCVCYGGRTGIECTDYIASYGDWSETGPCSSECGAAVRTSNRTCTNNADGTVRDVTDCESWGLGPSTKTEVKKSCFFKHCNFKLLVNCRYAVICKYACFSSQECTGLPECTCNVHPCLDVKGDHTDAPCNSLGEKLHKCYEEFINTDPQNPVCLKKCVCADGFQRKLDPVTGDICIDINECKEATGACFNSTTDTLLSSVFSCVNSAGDYSCTCAQGYHHRSGNKICEDVNECNDGTDECDDGDRATCTNTPGSYSCQCKTDFYGEGGKGSCHYEGRFILTDTSGMTEVKQEVSSLTYIPDGGFLSSDDETSVINSMYATRSGLIVFTSYKKGDPVQLAALAKPNIEKLLDWSVEKLNKINRNIVKVAAVYWADSIPAADGGIYTQWIPDLASSTLSADTLAKFKDIHEHASWAYVVTWSKMAPNIKSTYSSDLNSFQAVVVGDAKKQTIKVRYFYGDRQMSWNLAIYGNPDLKFYPARIGVVFNARGGQPVAEEYKYSGLLTKDYTLTEWTNTEAGIIYPDRYNADGEEDEVTSAGKFDYIITELPSSYDAPSKTCRDWLDNQSEDELLKLASMECPGSLNQISLVLKGSYVMVEDVPAGHVCYKPVNPSTDRAGSLLYPRCCYDTLGSLLSNTISAVQSVNGKSTVLKINSTETDEAEEIYWSCCDADHISSGQTPLSMCEEFLSHRPPGSSSQFHALSISQLRGDPHITSLDDVTYTFNGHGEFIMIESVNDTEFVFQGRTARVNGTGAATVFTGFAGQLAGGTIAEISFSPTFSSVDLYLNGTKMNNFDWNTVSVEGNVRPYNNSGLYVMSFENGITARINANFDLEMMTLETIAEPSLADKLRGLLGNFNGEKGDEFRFPNGTLTLNSTSFTESEI